MEERYPNTKKNMGMS